MNTHMENGYIRQAVMEDAAEISRLAEQLGYANTLDDMVSRLVRILADPDQVVLIVDVDVLKTAGYIHALKKVSLEVGPVVEVGGLVIQSKFRGMGLGGQLLDKAEDWAKNMGCQKIRLNSNIIRTEAHEFYKKRGYAIYKTQYAFVKMLSS
jgi:GNAT superfamily N-acetyltransferase